MRNIVYYVATSIDGYISGPEGDISGFIQSGKGVAQYLQDLQSFDTVLMGRKTYEFGYKYGLQPGQAPYPWMQHYIFSSKLKLYHAASNVQILPLDVVFIKQLKETPGSDIYLCGGGEFAGWALEHELIDILKLKINPLILGGGVTLFGGSRKTHQLRIIDHAKYEDGLQIISYNIQY